jgi:predicted enzyme related to lactoylglutathione lyase
MKKIITLLTVILYSFNTMAQNEHPMKIAMVSVLVEDPVKAFKYYTEVLGFEEYMYDPENYLAIVKSPLDSEGVTILLEPINPGGIEIAKQFKHQIYDMGMPVITFSASDIQKTYEELNAKGVKFQKEPKKTPYGYEAVFDDAQGNFIQLIQFN